MQEDTMEQFQRLGTGQATGDDLAEAVSGQAKTCKAATLTAWIAFLTCLIVLTHAVLALLESLFANEKFWYQTEQLLSDLAKCRIAERLQLYNTAANDTMAMTPEEK